jgi:hypothetical protein
MTKNLILIQIAIVDFQIAIVDFLQWARYHEISIVVVVFFVVQCWLNNCEQSNEIFEMGHDQNNDDDHNHFLLLWWLAIPMMEMIVPRTSCQYCSIL